MSKQRRTQRSPQSESKPGLIRRVILLLGMLGLLIWFGPMVRQSAIVLWDRPVNEVSIEGSFNLITREHIATLLAANIQTGFWQVNIQAVQAALEKDPWVDTVAIRRRWPDRLVIEVTEQRPIARWADRGFVNLRAELILTDDIELKLGHLPRLDAEDRSLNKLMQNYQVIAELMASRNLRLSQIKLDNRGSWKVQLSDGVNVVFGRHQLQERMRFFGKVYDDQLSGQWADVVNVDVRYNNGAAVAWRKHS